MDTTKGADHHAKSKPSTAARNARKELSTSTICISRPLLAPIETRSAISRIRAAA
jgi:hypothetical protein